MKQLFTKLPPKEQLFFIGAVLFAVYIAYITPWTTRNFERVKNAAIMDPAVRGSMTQDRVEAIFKDTQGGISQPVLAGGDSLNNALTKRFATPNPKPPFARETPFRPSSQKYVGLPPASLSDVTLARMPGFDSPVGIAPEMSFQTRPKSLPDGRIRLVRQIDETPLD